MKKIGFSLLLLIIAITSYSQLNSWDLYDLNSLCKKQDFESVKKFLLLKDYEITKFNTEYDHGSYYVIGEIEATKYLDKVFSPSSKEDIIIQFSDFGFYKTLKLSQSIYSNSDYNKTTLYIPLEKWKNEEWTGIDFSSNKLGYKAIGEDDGYLYLARTDSRANSINKIPLIVQQEFVSNEKIVDSLDMKGISVHFYNVNKLYGDLKQYTYNYRKTDYNSLSKWYALDIDMETTFIKGDNISTNNSKLIKIPILKNGKSYTLKIKFGSLVKEYILDSGASDMSIDDETYEYFDNSGLLTNENRLSDSKFQLADGSTIIFKRVLVPSFTINDVPIKKIEATRVQNGKPLLLGKSFLDSFKSWKIDNENSTLVVEKF